MCLLGVSLILPPFWGWNNPKTPVFWGVNRRFQAKRKILKVSCYRNYCIDFNQIWRKDRDHQVVIVGGPSRRPTNPRWRTAAILKTNRQITVYLRPFDRSWWNLARWRTLTPDTGWTVKILNFWSGGRHLEKKITKIAVSPQRFDRSLQNLVCWCKMGLWTSLTVKEFEFHKSKMADGRHFGNR